MPANSVYAAGWRQGSVLEADLTPSAAVRGSDGTIENRSYDHSLWVLATQDCSLDQMKIDNAPCVELRQVHDESPPGNWGIHSRKFLLSRSNNHYVVDGKPAMFISPKLLCQGPCKRLYRIADSRVIAFKTWLGNRYDRPAVPDELVPLAKAIAETFKLEEHRTVGRQIRDMYMTFAGNAERREYSLYAVIVDDADGDEIRKWLAERSLEIPAELGVLVEAEAPRSDQVTLQLIESSYCVDLSQLTWADHPEADGAY